MTSHDNTIPRGAYAPSNLDLFANYQNNKSFGWGENAVKIDTDMFVRRLCRLEPPSPAMLAGRAIHKVIETAGTDSVSQIHQSGWNINFEADINLTWPRQRELRIETEFDGRPINGVVDAVSERAIHDLKTTKSINLEKYAQSWQWRAYLWMTRMDNFFYDILKIKIDNDTAIVTDYDRLALTRYPSLNKEVEQLYKDFYQTVDDLQTNGHFARVRAEDAEAKAQAEGASGKLETIKTAVQSHRNTLLGSV